MNKKISSKKGDLLVVWIVGCIGNYIGEIIQERDDENNLPMIIKITENGAYSHLIGRKDFGIKEDETKLLQESTLNYFIEEEKHYRKTATGLKKLGIEDGKLTYVYSSEKAKIKLEKYFKNKAKKENKMIYKM